MSEDTVPGVHLVWQETCGKEAFLSLDELRQTFGLVGSPDELVIRRFRMLTDNLGTFTDPAADEILDRLGQPTGRARRSLMACTAAEVARTDPPAPACDRDLTETVRSVLTGARLMVQVEIGDPETTGASTLRTNTSPRRAARWLRDLADAVEAAGGE